MPHIDEETLALHALGEDQLSAAQGAHLQSCLICAGVVSEFARVVGDARAQLGTAETQTEIVPPPADVWSRVATELHLASTSDRLLTDNDASTSNEPVGLRASIVNHAPAGKSSRAGESKRSSTAKRHWPRALVAACTALVLGIVAGVSWERLASAPRIEATVANANLDPLPEWLEASGRAVVQEEADGNRRILIRLDAPLISGTYHEVWLLRPDASGLISLGVLKGNRGRFILPDGLDLDDYSVVDISQESFDGDPTHSGESVVRGTLSL